MIEKIRAWNERMKDQYEKDPLFHENERQANQLIMTLLIVNAVILVLVLAGVLSGFFLVSGAIVPAMIHALIDILILWFISRKVKEDTWWLKYFLLLGVLLVYAMIDSILTHKVAILMVLPVLISSRYFSQRLTLAMSVLTSVAFLISAILGGLYGWINMNDVTLPVGTTLTTTGVFLGSAVEGTLDRQAYLPGTLLFSYVPKLFMFALAAVLAVNIARWGRKMVEEQRVLARNNTRIETELQMATRIQEGMLPGIFPPFPERREFDIYASMNPAREVGGDFYDFFLVDDDHLVMVMADVAGKGVPAALFMMASKIILANFAQMNLSPAKILEAANNTICANNPQEMFVTVWLGVLEISTGILTAANAGHEYPCFKQGEMFQCVKDKHGLVIGGFEGITYKEYSVQLSPGDKVFVYTDGLTEATDDHNVLYGEERMLRALNKDPDAPPEMILRCVRQSVDQFTGSAEQFDDLTMLCLEYKGADRA